ncbi:AAA family ATPase [Citricoccus sp. NR2]|uniref:AAA family ATPase n=1 Tax=Citricoccus sp. NR2 TaxID=3004095 RepID=UPI003FA47049
MTRASTIRPRRQRWFWKPEGHGVIPLGTGTIAAGVGGEGKSTFMLDLAAQLTRGELPGDLHGTAHPVIIFGPEDDWATVMVPRLMGAGANLEQVFQVQAEVYMDHGRQEQELRFPLNVDLLEQAVNASGAKMVIIDPAPSLMDGDMNKVQDVRKSYGPLMALAQEQDVAMILINHFSKGSGNVGSKLSGSHAWRDLTRSYLAFASDEDSGDRVLSQDKNNYGTGLGSWRFTLDSVDVATEGGTTSVGKVRFLGQSDVTVGDIINRGSDDHDGDDEDRNAAQAFVLDYIRENSDVQEVKAADVLKAGRAAGFSDNEVKNARKRCKNPRIASVKSSFGSGWVWQVQIEEPDEGVTKVSKVSPSQDMTPSTPSRGEVTPSALIPCHRHGTSYKVTNCSTCLELAKAAS